MVCRIWPGQSAERILSEEFTSNRDVVFRFRFAGLLFGKATDLGSSTMFLLALEIFGVFLIAFITVAIGVGFFQAMEEDLGRRKERQRDEQQPDAKPTLKVIWPGRK